MADLLIASDYQFANLEGGLSIRNKLNNGWDAVASVVNTQLARASNEFTLFTGPASSQKTFTLPNASATILTSNAAVTVGQGGTGLTSGTSGGIPYFSSTSTMASSALLTNHGVIVGGGAGAAPAALAVGTTDQVLLGATGANPVFTTLTGDVTISAGATVIGAAKVTSAMLRNSVGLSVIGRSATTTGVPADIVGTAGQILQVNAGGTALAFAAVDISTYRS